MVRQFAAKFGATFPMFDKVDVSGPNTHPVYRFLRSQLTDKTGSALKWNYTKFLCDRRGVPRKRFGPLEDPYSFSGSIVKLLQQC